MMSYRGRFAPSPTGKLHLGSLISAVASYLDARANHGQWLIRIEDLDPPREEPGASKAIIAALEAHGLYSDEAIIFQSQRSAVYEHILTTLKTRAQIFPCHCSRQDLAQSNGIHHQCFKDRHDGQPAWRLKVPPNSVIEVKDRLFTCQTEDLHQTVGDFVLKRKDQLYAYQLAVVADDQAQHITHIVRGSDLLTSTPRQIFLQQALGYDLPQYMHIPVLCNELGQKLSKQNLAPALDLRKAAQNLRIALNYLQQPEPPTNIDSCDAILRWSSARWQLPQFSKQQLQQALESF